MKLECGVGLSNEWVTRVIVLSLMEIFRVTSNIWEINLFHKDIFYICKVWNEDEKVRGMPIWLGGYRIDFGADEYRVERVASTVFYTWKNL